MERGGGVSPSVAAVSSIIMRAAASSVVAVVVAEATGGWEEVTASVPGDGSGAGGM